MTAKILIIIALMTLTLVADAQQTKGNANVRVVNLSVAPARSTHVTAPVTGTNFNARTLYLRNCAHCHGADARGDDGPDLHGLDLTRDAITNRISRGKAGQMTAFAGKLQTAEINALAAYVLTLK